MKRILIIAPLALITLGLAACGESNGESSATKMTNVEVVDGTISDDMILLDTSQGDGTAVDNSATGGLYETIDNSPKGDASVAVTGKAGSEASKILAPTQPATPSAKAEPAPAAKSEPAATKAQ